MWLSFNLTHSEIQITVEYLYTVVKVDEIFLCDSGKAEPVAH